VSGPAQSTYSSCDNDVFATKLNAPNRVTRYTYDGLLRLIGAVESPCSAFAYGYDNVGNRTSVQVNGGTPATATYDAADQCNGWTYDLAGNLTSDGTATFVYDALNRTTSVTMGSQTRTNTYNGDGALIKQVANGTTTYYSQDLVAPLSQILQTKQGATTISLLYGMERLASKTGTTRTWYLGDALGSVRRTTTEAGVADLPIFYDPWGTVESGMVPTFGFTGEQHDTALGMVNLRARWYHTAKGTFTAHRWRTSESWDTIPYSHHGYAYGLSNPISYRDPTGKYPVDDRGDDPYCQDGSRRPPNGHCQYEELGSGAGTQLGGGTGGMPPDNEEYWDRLIHTRTELPDPIAVFVQDKGQPGQEIHVPTDLGPDIAIHLPTKLGDDRLITTCPDDGFPDFLTSRKGGSKKGANPSAGQPRPGYTGPSGGYPNNLPDDLQKGKPFRTLEQARANPNVRPFVGGPNGVQYKAQYIFVITSDGDIRLGSRPTHHHPDLVDGANVYGAGQIALDEKGNIIEIDDFSGHYYPRDPSVPFGRDFFPYMKHLLQEKGITVPDDVFHTFR
jgi:RHS repeat-associated protein